MDVVYTIATRGPQERVSGLRTPAMPLVRPGALVVAAGPPRPMAVVYTLASTPHMPRARGEPPPGARRQVSQLPYIGKLTLEVAHDRDRKAVIALPAHGLDRGG